MNSFHKKYTVCSLVLLCIVSCAKNKDGQDTLYPRVPLALIEVDGSNYVAPPILMSEMEGKPYIEHDFPFFNSSNYDVTVDLTGVSCGCLEPIILDNNQLPIRQLKVSEPVVIQAGERKTIRLKYAVRYMKDLQTHSAFFSVSTTDGKKQELAIRLSVLVKEDVEAKLPVINQDFFSRDDSSSNKTVEVIRYFRKRDNIRHQISITSSLPSISIVGIHPGEDTKEEHGLFQQSWNVDLSIKRPELSSPTLTGQLDVSLGPSNSVDLRVPIAIRRRYGVSFYPDSLNYGVIALSEPQTRRLIVSSLCNKEFRILSIRTVPDTDISNIAFKKGASNNRHVIDVSIKAHKEGAITAQLIMETDHADARTLTVPITATVYQLDDRTSP